MRTTNFKFFLISIVVLSLTPRFAYAWFFWKPIPIRPFWSSCVRLRFLGGWPFFVRCQQNTGAPAPLNCGAGRYAWAGGCHHRTITCPAGQVLIASNNNPCRCEAAGYVIDTTTQRICGDDPNGSRVCTTNGNVPAISSSCGLSCAVNYIESGNTCVRASVNPTSCINPPFRVGFGTDGCKCVNTLALGGPTNDQPCVILATASGPNGFANCRVTAAGGDPCFVECTPPFTPNYRTCV